SKAAPAPQARRVLRCMFPPFVQYTGGAWGRMLGRDCLIVRRRNSRLSFVAGDSRLPFRKPSSIHGRLFDVIDNRDIDRHIASLQLQAELSLHGLEDGG